MKLKMFQFFAELFFGNFLIFFVARYTLQSPFGCDGRVDGWTVIKSVLYFFFGLRYIKHYTQIYFYTQEKLSRQISCGFIFWPSWGVAPTIFKITLLRRHFSKMSLKVDVWEKNNRDFPLK